MDYVEILEKVGLIILLSGVIGLDREMRHKPAGIKTHMLVGMGSTIFMLVSIYIYLKYKGTTDPGRIAAQVVTGIGFLGAGTIIQSGGSVVGLTTAASLWAVAGIGLAVGCGMYGLSIIVTAAILFVFILTNKISQLVGTQIENIKEINTKIKRK
ncbi:MAG: MgtC/SapB family protein [Candidatus Goldbacteria bacterium]|nr:MgtC/SapB family protein [Candidatus Goldiibacteriota bacterium]